MCIYVLLRMNVNLMYCKQGLRKNKEKNITRQFNERRRGRREEEEEKNRGRRKRRRREEVQGGERRRSKKQPTF